MDLWSGERQCFYLLSFELKFNFYFFVLFGFAGFIGDVDVVGFLLDTFNPAVRDFAAAVADFFVDDFNLVVFITMGSMAVAFVPPSNGLVIDVSIAVSIIVFLRPFFSIKAPLARLSNSSTTPPPSLHSFALYQSILSFGFELEALVPALVGNCGVLGTSVLPVNGSILSFCRSAASVALWMIV